MFWVGRRTWGTPCADEGTAATTGDQHVTEGSATRRDHSGRTGRAKDSWGHSLLRGTVGPSDGRPLASGTQGP